MRTIIATIIAILCVTTVQAAVKSSSPQDNNKNQTVNGVRQGHWVIETRSGKLEEGEYVDGKKDGEWTTTAKNGTVRSRVTFDHGVARGRAVYYFDSGSVMEEGVWNIDHWEGDYVRYYENGNKACEFNFDATGKRAGTQVYYHENGNKMYEGDWRNGKAKGTLTIYDEDGRKSSERHYDDNGIFQGNQKVADSQETMETVKKFKRTGTYTVFNKEGRMVRRGEFVNGEFKNGEEYEYDANGKIIREKHYKNGVMTKSEDK